jgi:hypothetical protein
MFPSHSLTPKPPLQGEVARPCVTEGSPAFGIPATPTPIPAPSFWRTPARALLLFVLALSAWSFALGSRPQPSTAPSPNATTDGTLYRAIAARVANGESYYTAAPTEHRTYRFPLSPVITVRPPLLAEVTAIVGGSTVMGWLLRLTCLATFLAFAARFVTIAPNSPSRIAAFGLAAFSIAILTPIELAVYHDIWAGMLVALALALRRPDRWMASLAVALVAVLIRELVAPLLIVMAFSALIERRWREASAWGTAFVIASAILALHWLRVAALTTPTDLVSPGWLRALGWPWVAHVFSSTNAIQVIPASIGAALVPFALLGWMTVERSLALRIGLWLVGMACVFMVFGRSDNYYWGALVAPILPIGLAFAPSGITHIYRTAR